MICYSEPTKSRLLFSASLLPTPPQRLLPLHFLSMSNTYWLAMAPGGPVPPVWGRSRLALNENFFAVFCHIVTVAGVRSATQRGARYSICLWRGGALLLLQSLPLGQGISVQSSPRMSGSVQGFLVRLIQLRPRGSDARLLACGPCYTPRTGPSPSCMGAGQQQQPQPAQHVPPTSALTSARIGRPSSHLALNPECPR